MKYSPFVIFFPIAAAIKKNVAAEGRAKVVWSRQGKSCQEQKQCSRCMLVVRLPFSCSIYACVFQLFAFASLVCSQDS